MAIDKQTVIRQPDIDLQKMFEQSFQAAMDARDFFKFSHKVQVEQVIQTTLQDYDIQFELESDFLSLISCVDRSTWFLDWDFLTRL
jgi:hypothetical protein